MEQRSLLGITNAKSENFSEWYAEIVTKAELIDYYDVSGCYVLRPWAYAIWENIQSFLDREFKSRGVQNAYFPLLVTEKALTKEKDHIAGFAPEVAWVTKAGDKNLEEALAIRPTSETIIYPSIKNWIRSHRDLPLRLNQWCSVVRWEFKHPVPFLRSREFLWQEGHSAFATLVEASGEVMDILNLYGRVFEELLAVPVIKGKKSEGEKFAGALYTTTCEAFIPVTGKGIQGATSHCLGQNFAKMFDISFSGEHDEKQYVWQNSWGLTTRTIGIMIMMHGDDQGLILPPKIAPYQVVIVPIPPPHHQGNYSAILTEVEHIAQELKTMGIRVHIDARDNYKPAFKYNHWELRGVPLRVEYGARDHQNHTFTVVYRHTRERVTLNRDQTSTIPSLLDLIHQDLLERARSECHQHTSTVSTWAEFISALNQGHRVLAPWCQHLECEEDIKKKTTTETGGSAKSLCLPFDHSSSSQILPGTKCFSCSNLATEWGLFGKSY